MVSSSFTSSSSSSSCHLCQGLGSVSVTVRALQVLQVLGVATIIILITGRKHFSELVFYYVYSKHNVLKKGLQVQPNIYIMSYQLCSKLMCIHYDYVSIKKKIMQLSWTASGYLVINSNNSNVSNQLDCDRISFCLIVWFKWRNHVCMELTNQ